MCEYLLPRKYAVLSLPDFMEATKIKDDVRFSIFIGFVCFIVLKMQTKSTVQNEHGRGHSKSTHSE